MRVDYIVGGGRDHGHLRPGVDEDPALGDTVPNSWPNVNVFVVCRCGYFVSRYDLEFFFLDLC